MIRLRMETGRDLIQSALLLKESGTLSGLAPAQPENYVTLQTRKR